MRSREGGVGRLVVRKRIRCCDCAFVVFDRIRLGLAVIGRRRPEKLTDEAAGGRKRALIEGSIIVENIVGNKCLSDVVSLQTWKLGLTEFH